MDEDTPLKPGLRWPVLCMPHMTVAWFVYARLASRGQAEGSWPFLADITHCGGPPLARCLVRAGAPVPTWGEEGGAWKKARVYAPLGGILMYKSCRSGSVLQQPPTCHSLHLMT